MKIHIRYVVRCIPIAVAGIAISLFFGNYPAAAAWAVAGLAFLGWRDSLQSQSATVGRN